MRSLRVSQNFVPVSELKAQSADWLRRLQDSDDPVVVTRNGRPAAVLLSPRAFDALTEQARFVAAVSAGLSDAEAGRLHPHTQVVAELKTRYRRPTK